MAFRLTRICLLSLLGAGAVFGAATPGGDTTIPSFPNPTQDSYVGKNGAGTLSIDGGSWVYDNYAYLGYAVGANGAVSLSGAGTGWINSSDLYVGYWGTGTLSVGSGANVTARTLYASLADLSGGGHVEVGGAVVDGNLSYDSVHGTTQTFGSGGTLKITFANAPNAMGVGYKGIGNLQIADGLGASSTQGFLGYRAGSRVLSQRSKSTRKATVSGMG